MAFETNRDRRSAHRRAAMAATAMAVLFVALSSAPVRADDDDDQQQDWFGRIGSSLGSGANHVKKMMGLGRPPGPPQKASPSGCPEISLLDGTEAQRISVNGVAGNAGVKQQYSIVDFGRECRISGNQITLKVGVQGKVLLGPAGAPGTFDVPVRIAVVNKLDARPVVSKLYRVAASIPTGQTGTAYSLVADSLVVPMGANQTAQDFSIKVGLDTGGKGGDVESKPTHHRHRAKPVNSAAAQ